MTRDELLAEVQEQARLVGMGAERELALKAQVDRLKRVNAEMLEALTTLDPSLDKETDMVVLVISKRQRDQIRLAIAKARDAARGDK
jgi:hypothetical protein